MLNDHFVLDAVVHAFNLHPSNYAFPKHAEAIAGGQVDIMQQQPEGYVLPPEAVLRDWSPEETVNVLFNESATDVAVYHPVPVFAFTDGMSSLPKGVEALEKWPKRIIASYACIDPLQGFDKAIAELDRQREMFDPLGLKLYPTSWAGGETNGWSFDDEKVAFPIFEAAAERGINTIAVHKAVPLGPVPTGAYFNPNDIEVAAGAFPDINFEIVHGGAAFVDETAWLLGRFENIWVNLEFMGFLCTYRPELFGRAILGLMHVGGEGVLDRLLWGSGAMQYHPRIQLEAFDRFQFDDEVRQEFGLFGPPPGPMTEEQKGKILGQNYARLHNLDIEKLKADIAGDEFTREPGDYATPWSTTASADDVMVGVGIDRAAAGGAGVVG